MTIDYPTAVLWDMDGTLVDSEPYWMGAETELVESYGGTWTHDDGLTLIGSGLWNSARALQDRGVQLDTDEIVAHLTTKVQEQITLNGVPWRPGAAELLLAVREAGIKTALVTMSVRRMAQQVVDQIPFDAFDLLVTGDEVERPKPHPDAYLTAARRLGVEPGTAVAIEDSRAGLTSAVSAGTVAIGVPHIVALPESSEHTIWPTLVGRTVTDLTELVQSRMSIAAASGSGS